MKSSVIVPRQYAARDCISCASPKALLARIEIPVVFMQYAAETECYSALNRILADDIRKSLPVS